MQRKFIESKSCLDKALKAIDRENFNEAISILDHGISILGDVYLFDGLDDDTGTKLVLAEIQQEKGETKLAATLKSNVLSSRLEVYEHHFGKKIKDGVKGT